MSTTEIAVRGGEHDDVAVAGPGGALAVYAGQTHWSEEQEAALTQIGLAEAPDADRLVFLHVAQRAGLDPFAQQIYMIGRWDKDLGRKKWTIQTAIGGLRLIAERHPQYAGKTKKEWCGDDGQWVDVWLQPKPPAAARCGVRRHDRDEVEWGTCRFVEFAADNTMWKTKPSHMLAKCAEAAALRAAFPAEMSGLVTDDEVHGHERRARATRVTAQRESAPVDAAELTGQTSPAPAAAEKSTGARSASAARSKVSTEPRKVALSGGTGRIDKQHQDRLMAALRTVDWAGTEHGDSKSWASAVLGKDVSSWGRLICDEAATLVAKLDAGDLSTGASPAEPERDEVAEAYAALDAEETAAEGEQTTLDDGAGES